MARRWAADASCPSRPHEGGGLSLLPIKWRGAAQPWRARLKLDGKMVAEWSAHTLCAVCMQKQTPDYPERAPLGHQL